MSYRRSLSFSEQEQELLSYFDTHGKSDIVKTALDFYKRNKDKVIPDGFIEMLKLLKSETPITNTRNTTDIQSKLNKLVK
jgi:hypothetical protein